MGLLDTLLAFLRIGSEAAPLVAEIAQELKPAPAPPAQAPPAGTVTSGGDYLRGKTDQQRADALEQAEQRMTGEARERLALDRGEAHDDKEPN